MITPDSDLRASLTVLRSVFPFPAGMMGQSETRPLRLLETLLRPDGHRDPNCAAKCTQKSNGLGASL